MSLSSFQCWISLEEWKSQIATNLQVYAVYNATPGWLGCWAGPWRAGWAAAKSCWLVPGGLGRAAGWSLEGWLGCWLVPGGLAGPWRAGWAAGWSLRGWLVPARLAGLLGRVVDWSLRGWLVPGRLAGLLGRVADWSLEGWLVPGGLAWLLGRVAMLVTAQLIFSIDTWRFMSFSSIHNSWHAPVWRNSFITHSFSKINQVLTVNEHMTQSPM